MMCGHQASQQSTKPSFLLQDPERDYGPQCSILYGHQASWSSTPKETVDLYAVPCMVIRFYQCNTRPCHLDGYCRAFLPCFIPKGDQNVQYRAWSVHQSSPYGTGSTVPEFPGAVPCMVIRLASTVPRLPGAVPGERLWVVTLAGRESSPHNSLLCNQQTLYQTYKNIYKNIQIDTKRRKSKCKDKKCTRKKLTLAESPWLISLLCYQQPLHQTS